jgi:hypothetical protein
VQEEIQSMPPKIMTKYMDVTLGGDIMFVNKIRFFGDYIPTHPVRNS